MPNLLLLDYLQRCRAQYRLLSVPAAYTAEESARAGRIPPSRFAKVVMVRIDAELAMVVMPAHYHLVPLALRDELGARRIELATEREFRRQFPRCELGAIPPFGHLFGLRALIVDVFEQFGDVFCKTGAHSEILRMPFHEFRRLAHLDPVRRGAALHLRDPVPSHLQRLLSLARQQTSPFLLSTAARRAAGGGAGGS